MRRGLHFEFGTVSDVSRGPDLNPCLKGTLCVVNGDGEGQCPRTRASVRLGCNLSFMGKLGLRFDLGSVSYMRVRTRWKFKLPVKHVLTSKVAV